MAKKKKSGKKGGKKKSAKAPSGPPPIPHYEGFHPDGIPLKVYKIDREKVLKGDNLTPEQQELLAERGDDPATQPAQFLRVGEVLMQPVADLKRRLWELSNIPMERMVLFFQSPPEDGGRPVSELRGWKESWPWPQDFTIVQLADDLALNAYGIGSKTDHRKQVEQAEKDAFEAELNADPERKRKHELQKMADKLARQEAAKKKPNKKSKKGAATKGKQPKMSAKELAALEARQAKEAEIKRLEKIREQDKVRRWPENQLFLLVKPEGMPNLNAFISRPDQPKIETPKKTFQHPMPKLTPFENSLVKNETIRSELGSPITIASLSLHQLPPLSGQLRPQAMRL
eukprot:m.38473 g.38473  ORF g.38473 m.38473 type:complete len:343 (-) comp17926_c0_seq1:31-1059(-)